MKACIEIWSRNLFQISNLMDLVSQDPRFLRSCFNKHGNNTAQLVQQGWKTKRTCLLIWHSIVLNNVLCYQKVNLMIMVFKPTFVCYVNVILFSGWFRGGPDMGPCWSCWKVQFRPKQRCQSDTIDTPEVSKP